MWGRRRPHKPLGNHHFVDREMRLWIRFGAALLLVLLLVFPPPSLGYSVLTHEAVVDVTWNDNLRPLLLKRFPHSSDSDLMDAHAYAYGGAIIQDMGYYPGGNKLFSDLTHYFRTGDFIQAMLRDASTLDESAFALGALAHYAGDNNGHSLATNVVVPALYPELSKKYGAYVTYEENPTAHIKTEFSFDVLQVAKGRYAPESYHRFIGFKVALPLVEKAFLQTYGLELGELMKDEQRAANSYRYSISTLVPKATRVAWNLKQDEIRRDVPGETKRKFLYNIHRASYEKEWGKDYLRPNLSDKILAFVIRILPKIGPLKILAFRTPTPQAENLFEDSFNQAVDAYRHLLIDYEHGRLALPNDNFDVGTTTHRGQYHLNDRACDHLLQLLSEKAHPAQLDSNLRIELARYYASGEALLPGKKDKEARLAEDELAILAAAPVHSAHPN